MRASLYIPIAIGWIALDASSVEAQASGSSTPPSPSPEAQIEESKPFTQEPETSPTQEGPTRAIEDHVPGKGTKLAGGGWGELDFSLYVTIRYLNSRALDDKYTDASGATKTLDLRGDLQFQKVLLYFKGWMGVPQLRYLTYIWTSNASMGLGAQVVVAGNLTYKVSDLFNVGIGVGSLPTTRSTLGTFPFFLEQDTRTIADEYFRGSYTSGLWAWGNLPAGLHYRAMIGNNLSQLGIDAGQLDLGLRTYSGALWWTTSNFAPYEGLGDLEYHEGLAALFGAAFTQSREDKQSQPGTEAPENAQLRISDGRLIFDKDVFVPGVQLRRATYRMASVNGELKYRGWSLAAEAYYRRIDNLSATGPLPFDHLHDYGFQVQASTMVVPQYVQGYAYGAEVLGQYGRPWQLGFGGNYYPFTNRVLRVNAEGIVVRRSPVGNLSSPLLVGANGFVFVSNIELFF